MKEFPSCFGENGVQVADSSSSSASSSSIITRRDSQNVVSCVYHCKLQESPCFITVTWTKSIMGQGLSLGIDELGRSQCCCLCKLDIKPWLFSRRKGSKNLEVQSSKIDIFWDFRSAKFGQGPEPIEGYYVIVVFNHEMVLLLGDLKKEACKKVDFDCVHSSAILIAKREHIFGKKVYGAKVQFCDKGQVHNVTIECDTNGVIEPCLVIRVDGKNVIQVKRLKWKFRGNHTILVDGVPVEVFWDVHNWMFGGTNAIGNNCNNAVFMFQTCVSVSNQRMVCLGQSVSGSASGSDHHGGTTTTTTWAYSQQFKDSQMQGLGFSLILYAWKNE